MPKLTVNPEILPVDSIAGEAAVPPDRLTPDSLRRQFGQPPDWTPEVLDDRFPGYRSAAAITAAVLMPIVARESGPTLLMTRRTAHLNDHAGQVSLPGGRMDPEDRDATDTALRETEEEVGLHRRHVEVLGSLPQYFTGTGFRVTPVVGLVQPPFDLRADPFEVAEIFEVPLTFLMDGMNHQRRKVEMPGGGHRYIYTMPYQQFFIWGATAAMLRNLFHFLRA